MAIQRALFQHDDSGVLGLMLGFNVNGDTRIWNRFGDTNLNSVADLVGVENRHFAWNHKMKFYKGRTARMTGPEIVRFDRAGRFD